MVTQQEGGGLSLRGAQQGAEGGQLRGGHRPESTRDTRVRGWLAGATSGNQRLSPTKAEWGSAKGHRLSERGPCPALSRPAAWPHCPSSAVSSAGSWSRGLAHLGGGLPTLGTTLNTYEHPNTAGPRFSREPRRRHAVEF